MIGLSIDVKTTGFSSAEGDRIISVAVVELLAEGFGARFERMVHPGRSISAEATTFHGIRDQDVADKPTFKDIAGELAAFIGDRQCFGYYLTFGLTFFKSEFDRAGAPLPPGLLRPGVDLRKLLSRVTSGGRLTLVKACAAVGVDLLALRAHSAMGDALAAAMLLQHVMLQTEEEAFQLALVASKVLLDRLSDDNDHDAEDDGRAYEDDDLEVALRMFQDRRYDEAIARARLAVARDQEDGGAIIDTRSYDLAVMILRRMRRHTEEVEILRSFMKRALGREPTREELRVLGLDPHDAEYHQRERDGTLISTLAIPEAVVGRRPPPRVGKLAARLLGLLSKEEKIPETHEARLIRCRAAEPQSHVLQELAICLRKEITAMRNSDPIEANALLLELHATAQRYAFLHGNHNWDRDDPEWEKDNAVSLCSGAAANIATVEDLNAIILDYKDVGYESLTLLKKTDISRLIDAFGEPAGHLNPRVRHAKIWERFREVMREKWEAVTPAIRTLQVEISYDEATQQITVRHITNHSDKKFL